MLRPITILALAIRLAAWSAPADATPTARSILDAAKVKGGLVVHLGCGSGPTGLTAALRADDGFVVHGLDTDLARVETTRKHIRSLQLYGPVSVDQLRTPHLPYTDNLVNLLVVSDASGIPEDEMRRVLAPRGVLLTLATGHSPLATSVKPVPDELDEWSHYLHDPSNNAVAHDTVVGPPKHLQWVGKPAWTRHHDHMSSFNAMVTAGGRVFYVIDEGVRAEVQLPSEWVLAARDAFSGVLLWKRPIAQWHTQLWPLKSGPAQLPRRLVAIGDTVYATLGLSEPLVALDAATGETTRSYAGTEGTEEILCDDDVLFLLASTKPTNRPWSTKPEYQSYGDLASEPNAWAWQGAPARLLAVQAQSGSVLWDATSPVAPMTLTVDQRRVYFHDGESVVALSRTNGKRLWKSEPVARASEIRSWFAPTLVVHDNVLVFAGGEKIIRHKGGKDTMTALSADTGKVLWTADHPPSGYDSPEDVFIIDGLVWTAPTTNKRDTGTYTGRDLRTGEIKRTFPADDGTHMPHHRCHRAKATDRFIVASRTGIEYVDLKAEHWDRNDWVRGACLYGVIPANGLTYAPPHSCACYIVAKLNGFCAVAPARSGEQGEGSKANRLTPGPALAAPANPKSEIQNPQSDWPTYRADPARSGRSSTTVPTDLKLAWETTLGGRLSSPVIADGKVFAASVDTHTVHALDASTGKPAWSYSVGGRVDSPPTVWQGRAIFGSADGHVYCLRASDGALAWRFRAAPSDRRLMAWEQLESVWPVHGSVLVIGNVVHCVAGRSMFLDGGLRYLRLDAATGKLLSENVLGTVNPDTGKPLDASITWPNLPVALPDILSYDGKYVYMRSQQFNTEGKRITTAAPKDFRAQKGDGAHLFSPTGFLDDSWWHRTYWMYGRSPMSAAGGWYLAAYQAPAGRIMVCDDERVYAFGRRPQYFPRTTALEYHIFAANKEPEIVPVNPKQPKAPQKGRRRPLPTRATYDWSRVAPVLGRALVLANDTLFVAGPPDVVDQEDTIASLHTPETATLLGGQRDAYRGKKGGVLLAVSASDGARQAAYRLDSIPVFDGMAAASERLFISTTDGKVTCLAARGKPVAVAADVTVTDTPPPAASAPAASQVAVTAKHPDFQHVHKVAIAKCDLGWRLRAPGGAVGLALRKLEKPITEKSTLKLRFLMIPNARRDPSKPAPGNAFLAFGNGTEDAALIKCGLRSAGQNGSIVEGPLLSGTITGHKVIVNVNEQIDMAVTVDPKASSVKVDVLGETFQTKLRRPLDQITHVGYCVTSVASEFGPVTYGE